MIGQLPNENGAPKPGRRHFVPIDQKPIVSVARAPLSELREPWTPL
jgi:hypothetical protein